MKPYWMKPDLDETVRDETMRVWQTVRAEFSGPSLREAETSLERLDGRDAMGIADDAFADGHGIWFVQPMAKQVSRNSLAITRTLGALKARLELVCDVEQAARGGAHVVLHHDGEYVGCPDVHRSAWRILQGCEAVRRPLLSL